MGKKIEITAREREILSLINNRLNRGAVSEKEDTIQGIHKILTIAWNTPKETLHDMGISRYKIAQMYSHLLGVKGFISECQKAFREEPFFSYVY